MRLLTILLAGAGSLLAAPPPLYHDPAIENDAGWLATLPELLKPVRDTPVPSAEKDQTRVALKGEYRLPMPGEGQTLRLRLLHVGHLHLGFRGDPGTLISLMGSGRLAAFRAKWPSKQAQRAIGAEADPLFAHAPYLTRIDPTVDFQWGGSGPTENRPDDFAVRWEGALLVPQAGRYRIGASTDDGMRIYIDGKKLVEYWAQQGVTRHAKEIELAAGPHRIALEYFEAQGEAVCRLEWQPPGASDFSVIPAEVLRTSQDADAKPGLYGHYVAVGESAAVNGASRIYRLHDDAGQWNNFGRGNLDIRYQDGEIILARGEIILLRAAQRTLAPFIELRCSAVLAAAHMLELPPLLVPEDPVVSCTRVEAHIPFDAWETDERATQENSVLEALSDGGLAFRRHAGDAVHASTRIATKTGAVITLQVRRATHGAGLYIQNPLTGHYQSYLIADHARTLCQAPNDASHVDHHRRNGQIMPESFWLRFEIGCNQMLVSSSEFGRVWTLVDRMSVEPGKHSVADEFILGLKLDRSDRPCEIRIGSPDIRRWQTLERLATGVDTDLGQPRPAQRRSAAFRTLALASDDGASAAELASALRELGRRCGGVHDERPEGRWFAMDSLVRRIADSQWSRGDSRGYADLKAAWRDSLPLLVGVMQQGCSYPAPLSELHMLDLWTRADWDGLWMAAERDRFHQLSYQDHPHHEIGRSNLQKMVEEMRGIAADKLGIPGIRRHRHPLMMDRDRHTQNLLAEFAAALANGEIELAGRLLTAAAVPEGFAASPDDSELFLPIGTLLRQQALNHPPLQAHLRATFDAIANLRLAAARQRWQPEDFQAVFDQFPGTQAASAAALHLADRDLSVGRYAAAQSAYQTALDERQTDDGLRQKLQLVDGLIANAAAPAVYAPDHGQFHLDLLQVPSLSRTKFENNHHDLSAAGFLRVGDRIIVDHLSSQFAISADGKRVLWHCASEDVPNHPRRPTNPACVDDVVVTPAYFKDEKIWGLIGRRVGDGERIWRRRLPGHSVGNFLREAGKLMVFSYAIDRGYGLLSLHRVDPQRGGLLETHAIANFAAPAHGLPNTRAAIHGGQLYIMIQSSLLRCDLDGRLDWIRRLPRLSDPSMGSGHNYFRPSPPLLVDGQLFVQAENSPGLYAIDSETGHLLWSHWQRELRDVHLTDSHILVVGRSAIEVLDFKGQVIGRTPSDIPADSILSTRDGKLLIADIVGRETKHEQRVLRWLDPLTGETQEAHIPQHADWHTLRGIWSDGIRIFGFLIHSTRNQNNRSPYAISVLHPRPLPAVPPRRP